MKISHDFVLQLKPHWFTGNHRKTLANKVIHYVNAAIAAISKLQAWRHRGLQFAA
jgi:hypothetical protein